MNDQELKRGGDMYIIEFNAGDGYQCLFFGNDGKDIYPLVLPRGEGELSAA